MTFDLFLTWSSLKKQQKVNQFMVKKLKKKMCLKNSYWILSSDILFQKPEKRKLVTRKDVSRDEIKKLHVRNNGLL